jgi:hypothetical protein
MSPVTKVLGAPRLTAAVSRIRKSSGAWMVPGSPRIISAAVSPTSRSGMPASSSQRAVVAS